jgi:hypothetical protein
VRFRPNRGFPFGLARSIFATVGLDDNQRGFCTLLVQNVFRLDIQSVRHARTKSDPKTNMEAKSYAVGRFTAMKWFFILLIHCALLGTIKASVVAEVLIEGLPVKVLSSGRSYKVFEQYPWEGHSSRFGPKGNRLTPGNGVGVGKNIAHSLKLRLGDWIHMPDIGWRQVNESSSKRDGIEFFATRRDEYKSKYPRLTIDRVVFASPSQQARSGAGNLLRKGPRPNLAEINE